MTTSITDMEILKEIPGYKAIMKAVLKTQIQLLVEQLSDHTGEESIVLTASINDGSLSHLGSNTGKGFLEGRDEIKSQFLGYCLKSHHKRKTQEEPAPPYQRSNISHPGPRSASQQTAKRPRLHPVSLTKVSSGRGPDLPVSMSGDDSGDGMFTSTPLRTSAQSHRGSVSESSGTPSRTLSGGSPSNVKLEHSGDTNVQPHDTGTDLMTPSSLPSSIGLSHTLTSENRHDQADKGQSTVVSDAGDSSQESASIKVEPPAESELDLEITGVEMGDNSSQMSGDNWGQNVSGSATGFGPGTSADESFDQSGSQAGYKKSEDKQAQPKFVPPPSQPVFPGQLSPTVSTPQFDISGFDTSVFDSSTQGKTDNESSDLDKTASELVDEFLDNSNLVIPPYETGYEYSETGEPEGMFIKRKRGRPPGSGKTPYSQQLFESIKGLPVGKGYVRCELCQKVIKETSIYTHRQTHLGIKRFECEFCGKKFIQKGALMTHRRLHTGEKPFRCLRCCKSFAAHSGLLQHKCASKRSRDKEDKLELEKDLAENHD